ncbi:MAG TPA: alpha/beta fold hydrolase [Alphaproteobacteria bacterium]|nr:alpha/beta fold hydrolase [Alphaproteobacteria bacterium]
MHAAVLAASQKPLVENALQQIHTILAQVPADVDWLAFQSGVQKYLAAPHTPRTSYPQVGHAGRVTLRDAGGTGPTVVLVPSMVNRGYVLDLLPGHSMIEALRNAGYRVLFIDWGEPENEILTLEQIIVTHLVPLLNTARQVAGAPVGVVGYCMGGLLGMAGAILSGTNVVGKLALIATPWDFSVTPSSGHMLAARPVLEPWLNSQRVIPAEAMQQYFWLLDPWSPIRRFMAYGNATGEKQTYLTALEDWLNDGLALDAPIAHEILMEWYADNRTLNGNWFIQGKRINPAELPIPLWVAVGQRDNLVPPGCALPLIAQGRGAQVVMVDAGHVGLVVGRQAAEKIYTPLAAWLK